MKSYISIEKYASNNKVDLDVLISDVENGVYNTAKHIDGRWYLKPQEKCHSYKGIDDYITLSNYAKSNSVNICIFLCSHIALHKFAFFIILMYIPLV